MTNRTRIGAMAVVVGIGADAAETHGAPTSTATPSLRLAQEGTEVVVHFESPLDSIVGFEHEPANDQQRAALEEAVLLVRDAENIIRLPAGCVSSGEAEVSVPYVADDHGDDHDGADGHSDPDHDDDADQADHADHDDHADHADHESGEDGDGHDAHAEGEVHADLNATYKYRCEAGIEWLEVTAFATFDGLEEAELQAVGPDGAVVETLTPASPRAALSGS